MKTLIAVIMLCTFDLVTHAQAIQDASVKGIISTFESQGRLDSASHKVIMLPDSLIPSFERIDSIRQNFNLTADSIQNEYQSALAKMKATTIKVNSKLDNLTRLNLPTEKYKGQLDSLTTAGQSIESRLSSKLDELKSKTPEKLKALDLPPEYQGPIKDLTQRMNGLKLNIEGMKIPELQIPGFSLPDMKGLGNLTNQVGASVTSTTWTSLAISAMAAFLDRYRATRTRLRM